MDHKSNKQWVWLALDSQTREIVGIHIGDRDEKAAKKLWDSLPPVYRQCAVAFTDYWAAYGTVFLVNAIKLSAKKQEKLAMLKDLTIHLGKEYPV